MIGRNFLVFVWRITAIASAVLLFVSTDATAQGPTVTVLHTFSSGTGDGVNPSFGASLVEARDGSFYGVTDKGGSADLGTIFRITPGWYGHNAALIR